MSLTNYKAPLLQNILLQITKTKNTRNFRKKKRSKENPKLQSLDPPLCCSVGVLIEDIGCRVPVQLSHENTQPVLSKWSRKRGYSCVSAAIWMILVTRFRGRVVWDSTSYISYKYPCRATEEGIEELKLRVFFRSFLLFEFSCIFCFSDLGKKIVEEAGELCNWPVTSNKKFFILLLCNSIQFSVQLICFSSFNFYATFLIQNKN